MTFKQLILQFCHYKKQGAKLRVLLTLFLVYFYQNMFVLFLRLKRTWPGNWSWNENEVYYIQTLRVGACRFPRQIVLYRFFCVFGWLAENMVRCDLTPLNFYENEDISSIEIIPYHILGCFTAPPNTPKWALFSGHF